jgi:hypothetical protein
MREDRIVLKFEFEDGRAGEFERRLAFEFGQLEPFTPEQAQVALKILELVRDKDERVENEVWRERAEPPPRSTEGGEPYTSFIVGGNATVLPLPPLQRYIHINVKAASLTLAAKLLDLTGAQGLASVIANLSGETKGAWCLLQNETGDFCIALQCDALRKERKKITTKTVSHRIVSKPCPHTAVKCQFKHGGVCGANIANTNDRLLFLAGARVLETKDSLEFRIHA